jgi:hypothetical protein
LIIAIFLPTFCLAQTDSSIRIIGTCKVHRIQRNWPHTHYTVDGLVLSNKDTVGEGDLLTLGKGSLPNGDFNYIATPSNTMEAKLKRSTRLKKIEVVNIRVRGNKKYGYKFIIEAEHNYLIQLEDAIYAGEIILND